MSCDRRLIALPLTVLAAGCTPVDHGLGEAVKYDMAIQTINPDPVYGPEDAEPGYHGEKAQKATERYRKDQVNDRFRADAAQGSVMSTTEGIGTGSGGGGPR